MVFWPGQYLGLEEKGSWGWGRMRLWKREQGVGEFLRLGTSSLREGVRV